MPIKKNMIRTIALSFIFLLSSPAWAAPSCGERILGFVLYEEFVKGETGGYSIVEKYALNPIEEISPHRMFDGLLVNKIEASGTKLELELRRQEDGPASKKQSWNFSAWEKDAGYLEALGFNIETFVGATYAPGFVVLRLVLNGRTLCEDAPKPISLGE